MKKFFSLVTAALFGMAAFTLTSCDEDVLTSSTLEGTWEGNMYITSYYNNHSYTATYSQVEFTSDPYRFTSGFGYWVDYYSGAPWDYYASHIKWSVNNGAISIYFIEDKDLITIYDYRLTNRYFSGYIYDDYGKEIQFRLKHTSSPNWDGYDYGWDAWDYGHYSKKAINVEEEGDSMVSATNNNFSNERPTRHIVKE